MNTEIEETPQLQALVDQRVAYIKQATPKYATASKTAIMAMLTEPPEGVSSADYKIWDQSCDLCGRHSPKDLKCLEIREGWNDVEIIIVAGLCPACVSQAP